MTSIPNTPTEKEARAEEKKAQAETRAQSGREAMAEYRDREAAADGNASRLKGLRSARDAEAAVQGTKAPATARKARAAKASTAPDEGLRPEQLTTENDGQVPPSLDRRASGTSLPNEALTERTNNKAETDMPADQTGTPSRSTSGNPPRRDQPNTREAGLSDQVQGTMRDVAEGASELWDEASEQGRRYYRQGSQAIGQVDSVTVSGWLVAGAIGFGLAWLVFGHRSVDDVAERMSESSERYPRRRRA